MVSVAPSDALGQKAESVVKSPAVDSHAESSTAESGSSVSSYTKDDETKSTIGTSKQKRCVRRFKRFLRFEFWELSYAIKFFIPSIVLSLLLEFCKSSVETIILNSQARQQFEGGKACLSGNNTAQWSKQFKGVDVAFISFALWVCVEFYSFSITYTVTTKASMRYPLILGTMVWTIGIWLMSLKEGGFSTGLFGAWSLVTLSLLLGPYVRLLIKQNVRSLRKALKLLAKVARRTLVQVLLGNVTLMYIAISLTVEADAVQFLFVGVLFPSLNILLRFLLVQLDSKIVSRDWASQLKFAGLSYLCFKTIVTGSGYCVLIFLPSESAFRAALVSSIAIDTCAIFVIAKMQTSNAFLKAFLQAKKSVSRATSSFHREHGDQLQQYDVKPARYMRFMRNVRMTLAVKFAHEGVGSLLSVFLSGVFSVAFATDDERSGKGIRFLLILASEIVTGAFKFLLCDIYGIDLLKVRFANSPLSILVVSFAGSISVLLAISGLLTPCYLFF